MDILGRLFSMPPVRKGIWRLWYPFLTRRLRDEDIVFLNYAFEEDPPVGLELGEGDEADRCCIQLYHHVATQAEVRDKAVLEVSCGHGGGASWVTRALRPASYVGLDLNPAGIAFCERRHQVDGLRFVRGDAGQLPFEDEAFDVVINVEASHCYPDFPAFLKEAARVLRPGGHLLYADFRFEGGTGFADWERDLEGAPFEITARRDISSEVRRGMEANAGRSARLVENCLPAFLRSLGRDFAGVPGGQVHDALVAEELSYRSACLRKKASKSAGGG